MPPKVSNTLTEAELRLMKLLWSRGESSVSDLIDALPVEEPLAYTSVLTTVKILESKGYVTHRKEGRAFFYKPIVGKDEANSSVVRHVLSRFFNNSHEQLLMAVLGDEEIGDSELAKLKKRIAEAK